MIRSLAFGFALVAANPVFALSCLTPTVAGTYASAVESPADYVIGAGSLTFTAASNPPHGPTMRGGDPNQMIGYTQPAQFEGGLFTGQGFDNNRTLPITINVTCVSAWCGATAPEDYGLFFFRLSDGAYILDEGACPANSFPDTHPEMLAEVIDCHRGNCPGNW